MTPLEEKEAKTSARVISESDIKPGRPTDCEVNFGAIENANFFDSDTRHRFKSTTKLREKSTYITFFIVVGWLTIMAIVIMNQKILSDTVMITALATTTINILGLPLIILKGLFNDNDYKTRIRSNG